MEYRASLSIEAKLKFIEAHRGKIPSILFAARYFDEEVCQALVKSGKDVHAVDEFMAGVFHHAAMNDQYDLQLINFFASCGADGLWQDKYQNDPVIHAMRRKNVDFAMRLFKHFHTGESFLTHCICEDFDLLQKAFERDWSVAESKPGIFDEQLLLEAATYANLEVVRWVIVIAKCFGINYSAAGCGHDIAILTNAAYNHDYGEEIANYVIDAYKTNPAELINPLFDAVAIAENFLVAKALLDHGADVELPLDGLSLFERCVENDALDGVKFIFFENEGSAKIDAELLLKAARLASVEMCEWLAERCCRLDDHVWPRFLQSVAKNPRRGNKIVLAFRDKLQAHVNAADAIGITPLHSAMMNKSVGVAEALVEIGADLNVRFKGVNLLHFCLAQDYLDGAIFVYSKDKGQLNVEAAKRIAEENGNQEMKKWLLAHGN